MHFTCDMKTEASGPGLLQLYPFLIFRYFDMHLFCVNFVSKISPKLLYLETWKFSDFNKIYFTHAPLCTTRVI